MAGSDRGQPVIEVARRALPVIEYYMERPRGFRGARGTAKAGDALTNIM